MAKESLSRMIERVRPSVVLINRISGGGGTGVIFNADGQYGYIVTNQHVVGDAREVLVAVNDSTPRKGLVMGTDDIYDLAFVKIAGQNLRAVPFGDSSRVDAGTEVVAIGYPLHYQGEATVTRGIVSGRRYENRYRSDVIMSDVTMNPGNSGGPMLSTNGEVLGINTYISNNNTGNTYGFAIPESAVRTFASRLSVPIPPTRPQQPRYTQPRPTPQRRPAPKAGFRPNQSDTYLKVFGIGFVAGAILGVAVAYNAVGIEADIPTWLVASGLIGGSVAVFAKMKIGRGVLNYLRHLITHRKR